LNFIHNLLNLKLYLVYIIYAYIAFKKIKYNLGYFNTLEEAVEVRKQAEDKLFKPFIEWYEENYVNNLANDKK